jgi:hypothetical protein
MSKAEQIILKSSGPDSPHRSKLILALMGISTVIIVAPVSYIIFGDIHEGGHALACVARGGHVGGFGGWLHGVLPFTFHPGTHCSIKPYPAPVWAAGALTSIINWLASAFIVTLLLDAAIIKPALPWRVFWGCWSLWLLLELLAEVQHAYAPSSVWEDSTQFVRVTGIDPNFVGLPLAGVFVIALFIGWRILNRLW